MKQVDMDVVLAGAVRSLTLAEVESYLAEKTGDSRRTAIMKIKDFCQKGSHVRPTVGQPANMLSYLFQQERMANLTINCRQPGSFVPNPAAGKSFPARGVEGRRGITGTGNYTN